MTTYQKLREIVHWANTSECLESGAIYLDVELGYRLTLCRKFREKYGRK